MFVPLAHAPGHAQADFGEADVVIAGQQRRFYFFCLDLPHSDALATYRHLLSLVAFPNPFCTTMTAVWFLR